MDARTEPGPGPLLNRELRAAEGVRAGLGPPLGGSRVVCRFGLFLIDKIASRRIQATSPNGDIPRPGRMSNWRNSESKRLSR